MVTREQILEAGLRWRHAKWHHRALVRYRFCDCVRLFEGLAKDLGFLPENWEPPVYNQSFHLHSDQELVQDVLMQVGAVPVMTRQPGDLLLFQFGRSCSHAGLYLPDNYMLHAVKRDGKVVVNTLAGDWLDRLRHAYAFPGVAA